MLCWLKTLFVVYLNINLKKLKRKPKNSKYIYLQERAEPAGDTAVPWNKCVVSFFHAKINKN